MNKNMKNVDKNDFEKNDNTRSNHVIGCLRALGLKQEGLLQGPTQAALHCSTKSAGWQTDMSRENEASKIIAIIVLIIVEL